MTKNNIPILSIIIPTFEDDLRLEKCLSYLQMQNYPKSKIEILIMDGSNSSKTTAVAKKFGAHTVYNKKKLAEPGVALGMKLAKGSLLMVMAVDNEYHDANDVKTLVNVFDNLSICAAFPRHESFKGDTLFTKYINVFSDPATHFLYGDATNGRTFKNIYKILEHTATYDIYDFSTNPIHPLIALAQGFVIRKSCLDRKKTEMDDIQPVMDLINKNKPIAYVYGVSLYHHTIQDMMHFFRKQQWAMRNILQKKSYGLSLRKNSLTSIQKKRIYIYPLYGLCICIPILRSLFKYLQTKEPMWLFHPVIVFISCVAIVYEYATITLHRNASYIRK